MNNKENLTSEDNIMTSAGTSVGGYEDISIVREEKQKTPNIKLIINIKMLIGSLK